MSGSAGTRQRKSRLEQIQLRLRQQIHEEHRNQFSALEERKRLLQKERQQVNQQRRAIDSLRKKSLQSRENSITIAGELSRSRSASEKLLKPNIRYRGHRVPPLQEERRSAPLRERTKPDVDIDPRALSASKLHDRKPRSPDDSRHSSANMRKSRHPLAQANNVAPQKPASSRGDTAAQDEEPRPEENPMQHSAEDAFSQFEQQAEKQRRLKEQEAQQQEKEQEKQRAKEAKKRRKKLDELKRRQEERQQRMKKRAKARDAERQNKKQQGMDDEASEAQEHAGSGGAKRATAPDFDEQPLPTHRAASKEATPRKQQQQQQQPRPDTHDNGFNNGTGVEAAQKTPDAASESSRSSSAQHAPRPPASQNPSRGQRRYGRGASASKRDRAANKARTGAATQGQQQRQQQKEQEKNQRTKPRAPPGEPIRQQVEELMPDGSVQMIELVLYPCSICGRNFKEERLEAHKRACEANSKKKRKKFDMTKQRLNDLGHDAIVMAKKADKTEKKYKKKARKGNWRAKHEQFVAAIRAAKGADVEVPTVEDPDLVKCNICGRTFNEDAAKRHKPVCERNAKKAAMSKGRGGGKSRGRGRGRR